MPLPSDFPHSPHVILEPGARWLPDERDPLLEKLPPLVQQLREQVKEWRDKNYAAATDTSRSLMRWWFQEEHFLSGEDGVANEFRYYFAQQEAVETIIYLYEVAKAKDKYDLIRYDSSGAVSHGMFDESWLRFVVKMATGSGKTKVLSLALAWCYFHKLYEPDSELARNFLIIAPNIIVLDRLRRDFEGLRIFHADPVLPDNGHDGRSWRDDFQLAVHVQDDVRTIRSTGNIFLTNIHRVYSGADTLASPDDEDTKDYFLGKKPVGATTDSKVDLGVIVRDIDELVVFNDEAHHIHDSQLAWFKSIEDIHNRLRHKNSRLALQVDTSATPKHNNGAIFVQTVADYPLVEAIFQNVVKHPVLPDAPSRAKLVEQKSAKFTEKYADYIELGVIEWRKAYTEHQKLGKQAILFVMTDDTRNCDEVAEYLEQRYPDLKDSVLTIHTKNNGEISEVSSGKKKEELEALRKQANEIDEAGSPWKAIVSVLMLKEGWDVRNVTTIVGLRAYTAKSNVLPEQTLGRGLRRMYAGDAEEYLSVVGTDAFMEFVESIQREGVELQRVAMGAGAEAKAALVVEVDTDNMDKDLNALDIAIPALTPRIYREYKDLESLDISAMEFQGTEYHPNSEEDKKRDIVFKDMVTDQITHITKIGGVGVVDYRNIIGYFTQHIIKDLHLVSSHAVLYPQVKLFVQDHLFGKTVDLESLDTLRRLNKTRIFRTVVETFKKAINDLTVQEQESVAIHGTIQLRKMRPFRVKHQSYVTPEKSVFNRIVGDSNFELEFAGFLEGCADVVSYAKNYWAVHFKLDYVNADGNISNYYPDFIVKLKNGRVVIVETKGQEDLDVPLKMERLRQWCDDINAAQRETRYDFVFVDDKKFAKYPSASFAELLKSFRKYK